MAYNEREQERQVRAKQKHDALVEADINDAVLGLMQTRPGRRLVWWLLQIGRVGGQPYSRDPYDTAFNCGELNVGNQILARVTTVDPQGYLNMQKEQLDETELAHVDDSDDEGTGR